MIRFVAPTTAQESVELAPAVTVLGLPRKELMVGLTTGAVTVTTAGARTLPTAFVAVRV
jgi:hypothetical protein